MPLRLGILDNGARLATTVRAKRIYIPTGCDALDSILGGGFATGEIVELFGPPTSGRTTVACCAAARVLADGASVLYVDTEGGIVPPRVRELVAAALAKLSGSLAVPPSEDMVTACLERMLLSRVCSWDELAAGIAHILPHAVTQSSQTVRLVVVDTVALPHRLNYRQGAIKRLEAFAGRMADLAMRFDVAVILVNNARLVEPSTVSPRPFGDTHMYPIEVEREVGVAALGDAWAHVCPCRLGLGWDRDRRRVAHLIESSRMRRSNTSFCITSSGVQDND